MNLVALGIGVIIGNLLRRITRKKENNGAYIMIDASITCVGVILIMVGHYFN